MQAQTMSGSPGLVQHSKAARTFSFRSTSSKASAADGPLPTVAQGKCLWLQNEERNREKEDLPGVIDEASMTEDEYYRFFCAGDWEGTSSKAGLNSLPASQAVPVPLDLPPGWGRVIISEEEGMLRVQEDGKRRKTSNSTLGGCFSPETVLHRGFLDEKSKVMGAEDAEEGEFVDPRRAQPDSRQSGREFDGEKYMVSDGLNVTAVTCGTVHRHNGESEGTKRGADARSGSEVGMSAERGPGLLRACSSGRATRESTMRGKGAETGRRIDEKGSADDAWTWRCRKHSHDSHQERKDTMDRGWGRRRSVEPGRRCISPESKEAEEEDAAARGAAAAEAAAKVAAVQAAAARVSRAVQGVSIPLVPLGNSAIQIATRAGASLVPQGPSDNSTSAALSGTQAKKRKTRWDNSKEPGAQEGGSNPISSAAAVKAVLLSNVKLPEFVKELTGGVINPEVQALHGRLNELSRELQSGNYEDSVQEGGRSPSPEPEYNSAGVRTNTREARARGKALRERQLIIAELIKKDSAYKPPADYRPPKFSRKLYVPTKEHPGYNFIGLIIGPRGNTQKKMEKETGAKIMIRGKGSQKEGRMPTGREPKYHDPSENDELHVYVEAETEASCDQAAAMVQKLLTPQDEQTSEHKRRQLMELASINGTIRPDVLCHLCGAPGHRQFECPEKGAVFRSQVICKFCGDGGHPTNDCPVKRGSADGRGFGENQDKPMDAEYQSFLAEVGAAPPSVDPDGSSLGGGIGRKPGLGFPETAGCGRPPRPQRNEDFNLYVGFLPYTVDDQALYNMFAPFGIIVDHKIIKDRSTGGSRGFGFVCFSAKESADAAVQAMHRYHLEGKPIAVRFSQKGSNQQQRLLPVTSAPGGLYGPGVYRGPTATGAENPFQQPFPVAPVVSPAYPVAWNPMDPSSSVLLPYGYPVPDASYDGFGLAAEGYDVSMMPPGMDEAELPPGEEADPMGDVSAPAIPPSAEVAPWADCFATGLYGFPAEIGGGVYEYNGWQAGGQTVTPWVPVEVSAEMTAHTGAHMAAETVGEVTGGPASAGEGHASASKAPECGVTDLAKTDGLVLGGQESGQGILRGEE